MEESKVVASKNGGHHDATENVSDQEVDEKSWEI
jgi:hypothetical protein